MRIMKKLRFLIWLFPICVCIMIFDFSADTGEESTNVSMPLTLHVVEKWNDFFHLDWTEEKVLSVAENTEFFVRKLGHMSEYAFLAISVMTAWLVSAHISEKQQALTFIFCVFYACTDEFHQLFVPQRSGRGLDILIDSTGAFLGMLLFGGVRKLVLRCMRRWKKEVTVS